MIRVYTSYRNIKKKILEFSYPNIASFKKNCFLHVPSLKFHNNLPKSAPTASIAVKVNSVTERLILLRTAVTMSNLKKKKSHLHLS